MKDFTTSIAGYPGSHTKIVAHGNVAILDSTVTNSLYRSVREIEARNLSHLAVREVLVDTIRKGVLRRGDLTVSKNCLSLCICRHREIVNAGQHSLESDEWVMPRIVGPGIQLEVWSYGDSINTRRLETVGFLADVNTDTLRAYIEVNDEAKYWASYAEDEVARISFWGELQTAVRLAKFCGLKRIGDVHSLLVNAHGWGEVFLNEYYRHLAPNINAISRHGPLMLIMVAANAEKFSAETLMREFSFIDHSILEVALGIRRSHSNK